MTELSPESVMVQVKTAHARERELIGGLTEEQVRAPSALPGWSRGHVLSCRRAFLRAASRQIEAVLAGKLVEFYAGGRNGHEAERAGRDAEIEEHAYRPGAELVREVKLGLDALDESWSRVGPSDWTRETRYRKGTLLDLLLGTWREAEVHSVDFDLGVRTSDWSPEFCAHVFAFLSARAPDDLRIELAATEGGSWVMGAGAGARLVRVRGARNDLAAWLTGREPLGPLESSSGELPELRRGTGRAGASR